MRRLIPALALLGSLALHGGLLAAISSLSPTRSEPVEIASAKVEIGIVSIVSSAPGSSAAGPSSSTAKHSAPSAPHPAQPAPPPAPAIYQSAPPAIASGPSIASPQGELAVPSVPGTGEAAAAGLAQGNGEGTGSEGASAAVGGAGKEGAGSGAAGGGDAALAEISRKLAESAARCYPRQARRLRAEGTARIRFCIDERGEPKEAQVVESSGIALLDEAALGCVLSGAAPLPRVPDCLAVPVNFTIGR